AIQCFRYPCRPRSVGTCKREFTLHHSMRILERKSNEFAVSRSEGITLRVRELGNRMNASAGGKHANDFPMAVLVGIRTRRNARDENALAVGGIGEAFTDAPGSVADVARARPVPEADFIQLFGFGGLFFGPRLLGYVKRIFVMLA